MFINNIYADGFRNLKDLKLELDPKMNVICGDNAQGKTNIIEAIWLCTGCRTFRSSREKNFVGFDRDHFDFKMTFENSRRVQEIAYGINAGSFERESFSSLNGVKYPALSRLFGEFVCVAFTPEDLAMVKGSPEVRRTFLDMAVSYFKPSYLGALRKYIDILDHRNKLLKTLDQSETCNRLYLDVWDEQLAAAGAFISVMRYNFCNMLQGCVSGIYSSFSGGREVIEIRYKSSIYDELEGETDYHGKLSDIFIEKLKNNAYIDIKRGFTSIGAHRDDICIEINGLPVKEFGSQGQARSAALAIKLAFAKLLKKERGEPPVILLDDILSELDPERKSFILNNIDDMQVIITCCDSSAIAKMRDGKIFEIKGGRLKNVSSSRGGNYGSHG